MIPLSKIIFSKSTTIALLDSDKNSSSNKKDFSPFWNKNTAIISNKLWMPTLTDTQNGDLVHLNSTPVPKKPLLSLFKKKRIINSIPDDNKLSSIHFTSDSVDNTPMILTEKIRIFPTHEQKLLFNKCFGATRKFYNDTIKHLNDHYKKKKKEFNNHAKHGCIFMVSTKSNKKQSSKNKSTSHTKNKKSIKRKARTTSRTFISNVKKKIKSNAKRKTKSTPKKRKTTKSKKEKFVVIYKQCCNEITRDSKYFCNKHKNKKLNWSIPLSLKTLRPLLMKNNSELSKTEEWQKEIPNDTRQLAIQAAINSCKSSIALLKSGHIKSFDLGFKSKKDKEQVFYVDYRAMNTNLRLFPKLLKDNICALNRDVRRLKKLSKEINNIKLDITDSEDDDSDDESEDKNNKAQNNFIICKKYPDMYYICLPLVRKKINIKSVYNTVSIDPGKVNFLTFYSSEGICGSIGKNIFKKTAPIIKKINKLKSLIDISKDKKKTKKLLQKNIKHNGTPNIPQKLKNRGLFEITKRTRRNMRRRCAKLRTKVSNIVRNMHHQASLFLCRNFKYILFPKLEVKKLVNKEKRNINKGTTSELLTLSHGKFMEIMKYKTELHGRTLIICDEIYTSKTCGKCGKIKDVNGRIYECKNNKCKMSMDRDMNGARNILLKYLTKIPKININKSINLPIPSEKKIMFKEI